MEKPKKTVIHILSISIGIFLFVLATYVLHQRISNIEFKEVLLQLKAYPPQTLFLSFIAVLCTFFAYSLNDVLALKYIHHRLPYRKTLLASFVGYTFSYNIGHPLFSGGGTRFRLYSRWGFKSWEIIKLILFYSMIFWIGFFFVGGVTLSLGLVPNPKTLPIPGTSLQVFGLILLGLYISSALLCAFYRKKISFLGKSLHFPHLKMFFSQSGLGVLQWILEAMVLFILLPKSVELPWVSFLGVYAVAMLAGFTSQIPGGWGIFETVIIFALEGIYPTATLVAALLLFRLFFYLIPFVFAIYLFGHYGFFKVKTPFDIAAINLNEN